MKLPSNKMTIRAIRRAQRLLSGERFYSQNSPRLNEKYLREIEAAGVVVSSHRVWKQKGTMGGGGYQTEFWVCPTNFDVSRLALRNFLEKAEIIRPRGNPQYRLGFRHGYAGENYCHHRNGKSYENDWANKAYRLGFDRGRSKLLNETRWNLPTSEESHPSEIAYSQIKDKMNKT